MPAVTPGSTEKLLKFTNLEFRGMRGSFTYDPIRVSSQFDVYGQPVRWKVLKVKTHTRTHEFPWWWGVGVRDVVANGYADLELCNITGGINFACVSHRRGTLCSTEVAAVVRRVNPSLSRPCLWVYKRCMLITFMRPVWASWFIIEWSCADTVCFLSF